MIVEKNIIKEQKQVLVKNLRDLISFEREKIKKIEDFIERLEFSVDSHSILEAWNSYVLGCSKEEFKPEIFLMLACTLGIK